MGEQEITFKSFEFEEPLNQGLDAIGFETPTPIQAETIPLTLAGRDVIGCAQTGTGKTAAFLLPVIQYILKNGHDGLAALIVVPTRELAVQIDQQVEGLGYFTGVSSIAIYGGKDGVSFGQEKQALSEGADIIIATPGRLIAHLNLGYVNFQKLKFFILDEADRMLDMGFSEDIEKIEQSLPSKRNTLLFSATMPSNIRKLAKKILNEPAEINIAISKPPKSVLQAAFSLYEAQKTPLIVHLLNAKPMKSVVVFCATKKSVNELDRALRKQFKVGAISSDLSQDEREEALRKFKNGEINVMVATNIMSRGIDIDGIELVINYDVPKDAEDYVHRIGRTARGNSTGGIAFTLISPQEQHDFSQIEELIEQEVRKIPLPETIGEAPEYSPKSQPRSRPGRNYKKKPKKR